MSQATAELVRRELGPVEITPIAAAPGYWKAVGATTDARSGHHRSHRHSARHHLHLDCGAVGGGCRSVCRQRARATEADRHAGPLARHRRDRARSVGALCYGGRLSLLAGILPVSISLVVGGFLGILAGYAGGLVGTLIMRTMDVFYAFPSILLAIAICGLLGNGLVEFGHRTVGRLHPADGADLRNGHHAGATPRLCRGGARVRHDDDADHPPSCAGERAGTDPGLRDQPDQRLDHPLRGAELPRVSA